MTAEILFETLNIKQGKIGRITLNRPNALNALNHGMITALKQTLTDWSDDKRIVAVFIQSLHEKAFCAGGDIKRLYQAKQQGEKNLIQFFQDEYALNSLIHHYPKPYLAFLQGIVMGGGAGISIHGSHRICTPSTRFAMPETGIGFYPDIGASYFLSRLPLPFGRYLGLTGSQIFGADCLELELTTHLVEENDLNAIQEALMLDWPHVNNILKQFNRKPESTLLKTNHSAIQSAFTQPTIEAVIDYCQRSDDLFLQNTATTLLTRCPLSLKITWQLLSQAATLSFDHCMQMELSLTSQFLTEYNFFEGIRAVVIDKDNQPKWQPATLQEIDQHIVDRYFQSPLITQQ